MMSLTFKNKCVDMQVPSNTNFLSKNTENSVLDRTSNNEFGSQFESLNRFIVVNNTLKFIAIAFIGFFLLYRIEYLYDIYAYMLKLSIGYSEYWHEKQGQEFVELVANSTPQKLPDLDLILSHWFIFTIYLVLSAIFGTIVYLAADYTEVIAFFINFFLVLPMISSMVIMNTTSHYPSHEYIEKQYKTISFSHKSTITIDELYSKTNKNMSYFNDNKLLFNFELPIDRPKLLSRTKSTSGQQLTIPVQSCLAIPMSIKSKLHLAQYQQDESLLANKKTALANMVRTQNVELKYYLIFLVSIFSFFMVSGWKTVLRFRH